MAATNHRTGTTYKPLPAELPCDDVLPAPKCSNQSVASKQIIETWMLRPVTYEQKTGIACNRMRIPVLNNSQLVFNSASDLQLLRLVGTACAAGRKMEMHR